MSHQPPRVFESITQEPLLALFPRGFALPCCSKLSLLAHLLPSCLVMSHRGQMDCQGPPRTGWAGPSYPRVPCGLPVLPQGNPFSIIQNPDRPVLTTPPHLPETPYKFLADATRTQMSSVMMGLWADVSTLKISFPVCATQRQGGANMQTPCNGLEKENKYLEPRRRRREGLCRHCLFQLPVHPASGCFSPTVTAVLPNPAPPTSLSA